MTINKLIVDMSQFQYHIKTFKVGLDRKNTKRQRTIPPAILSFSEGILSIEGDDKLVAINAEGDWHGRARFSFNTLKALALVPPNMNPIIISYQDERLTIGGVSTPCNWESYSYVGVDTSMNPSMIDIIAMWRTQPTEDLLSKDILKVNQQAQKDLVKATASAAKKLADFDVTQDDLLALIEKKVQLKISLLNKV